MLQEPVRVMNVDPHGPASRGGLEVGDLLLEVNGVAVLGRPLQEIMTVVRGKAGSTVELVISHSPSWNNPCCCVVVGAVYSLVSRRIRCSYLTVHLCG